MSFKDVLVIKNHSQMRKARLPQQGDRLRNSENNIEASSLKKRLGSQLLTIDNFFDDFDSIREEILTKDFSDGFNTADGVTYPHMCTDVPVALLDQIVESIGEPDTVFLRMSPEGVIAPHPIHSDTLQANVTMLVFINDPPPGVQAGTAIVQHKESRLIETPRTQYELGVWQSAYRDPDQWEIVHFFEMRANRAILFDSRLMHMAMPVDGFGQEPHDARLVFGAFFP